MSDHDLTVGMPVRVTGCKPVLREAEVTTVNADGTIDCRPVKSRAGLAGVRVPSWYTPGAGDRVLVDYLDGDLQQPVATPFTLTTGTIA